MPSAWGMAIGLAVYALGVLLTRDAWAALVQPLPEVPVLHGDGRTVPTEEHAGPWAAAIATAFLLGRWQTDRTRNEEEPS